MKIYEGGVACSGIMFIPSLMEFHQLFRNLLLGTGQANGPNCYDEAVRLYFFIEQEK
jgi:hypothetical protein